MHPYEDHGSLQELARAYAELAAQIDGVASTDDALTRLVRGAVDIVPGARYASVSRRHGEQLTTVAQTDPEARQADAVQYELGEGPCVDAATDGGVFRCEDLRADARWPRFGPRAAQEAGVRSLLSIRLYLDEAMPPSSKRGAPVTAGLNLYATRPQAFGEESYLTAMLAATYGAWLFGKAVARGRADQLTNALESNREIGVAMGILMHRDKLTRDQAFDLLRIASQTSNRKLATIASEVADTGQLRLPSGGSHARRG